MGFKPREATVAIAHGRAHVGEDPSGEDLLRAALALFAPQVRTVASYR
jgi:hypothetical protein